MWLKWQNRMTKHFFAAKLAFAIGLVVCLFIPVAHWTLYFNAYVAERTIELATISPVKLLISYPEKTMPLIVAYALPLFLTLVAKSGLGNRALVKVCCHLLSLSALVVVSAYVRFCISVADPLIGAYVAFTIVGVLAVIEFFELWV